MKSKITHITNGDIIADRLLDLNLEGNFIVWREMFCEGPTDIAIEEEETITKRQKFLKKYYKISPEDYLTKFVSQLKKIDEIKNSDEIILWFEYDLFCHINMVACISLLIRKEFTNIPIYLVCSGRIKNEEKLKGLGELTDPQLQEHFRNKILLNQDDLQLADTIWTLYCEQNPMKIAGQIKTESSFTYLSNCLRAHLQRFPDMKNSLNSIEYNILKMINTYQIKNIKQLMGYALEYQGYYGYGDMQMRRVLAKLFQFMNQTEDRLLLSERGQLALNHSKNFYNTMSSDWWYGGVNKYDYLYDNESHKLLKL